MPMKAGMLCTINGETFYSFTKNIWVGDSGTSFHISNNDTGLFDVTEVNKFVEGSLGNMPATKKGMLHRKVCQVDGTEGVHILWPVKYCPKAGAKLYYLKCELSQGNKV